MAESDTLLKSVPYYLRRYWIGWSVTFAIMLVWPVAMVCAGPVARRELPHEVTYFVFQIVFVPVIVGLCVGSQAVGKRGSKKLYIFTMVIGGLVAGLLIPFFEWKEFATRRIVPYMLKSPAQEEAKELEDKVREIWDEAHELDKDNMAKKHELEIKWIAAKNDLDKKCMGSPRNHMPLVNSLLTVAVAFVLIFLALHLIAKVLANLPKQDYPYPVYDAIIVALAFTWPPMRLYVDWHVERFLQWTFRSGSPFSTPVIILFFIFLVVILVLALVRSAKFQKEFAAILGKSTSLTKAAAVVGAILSALLGIPLTRLEIYHLLESQLNNEATAIGFIVLNFLAVALTAFIGHELTAHRARLEIINEHFTPD